MNDPATLGSVAGGARWRVPVKLTADIAARGLVLVLFIAAARLLDPIQFGAYAFALAIGLIGGQLADGGLHFTLLRRLAAEPDADTARTTLASALRARLLVAIVTGALAAVGAALVGTDAIGAAALAVVAASQVAIAHAELWLQASRAAGRLELEAATTLAARLTLMTVGLALLVLGLGAAGLAAAHVAGALVALALARRASRAVLPGSIGPATATRRIFVESLPLAAAGIASLLMFRIDVVLLQWLRGSIDVGVYAAAFRPFEVMLLPSAALMAWGFPALVRAAAKQTAERRVSLAPEMTRLAAILLALAVSVAAIAWLVGPALLVLAFGAPYAEVGPVFRLLVVALPAIYLNALLTQALIALGRPVWVALAFGLGLAVNVIGNLLLIPQLGPHGAALATIAAEAALLLGASAGLLLRSRRY